MWMQKREVVIMKILGVERALDICLKMQARCLEMPYNTETQKHMRNALKAAVKWMTTRIAAITGDVFGLAELVDIGDSVRAFVLQWEEPSVRKAYSDKIDEVILEVEKRAIRG